MLPPDQLQAFNSERTGAVVGESLAKQFGWKIGDDIPLQATIWPTKGSNDWHFKLVGIFKLADKKREGEERQMMFHWKYFDEANDFIKGQVHWYVLDLDDASKAVAKAIDAMSENSDHETKTQTEQAFNQAFFKQIGDIGLIVTAVMSAVFFTLLLLAGNTMAQAVRERIPELAVLKTIGFSNRSVLWLVLMESIVLIVIRRSDRPRHCDAADPGGKCRERRRDPARHGSARDLAAGPRPDGRSRCRRWRAAGAARHASQHRRRPGRPLRSCFDGTNQEASATSASCSRSRPDSPPGLSCPGTQYSPLRSGWRCGLH